MTRILPRLCILLVVVFGAACGDDDTTMMDVGADSPEVGACIDIDGDSFGQGCDIDDCDDGNSLINPDASEVCGNLIDDDCDGIVDQGCECEDQDFESCGSNEGVCEAGIRVCVGGMWGNCDGSTEPTTTMEDESVDAKCNGVDDNCNGEIDEGCGCSLGEIASCGTSEGVCQAGTRDCQADGSFGPCVGEVGPQISGSDESVAGACNGRDDNCDGSVDEGCGCSAGETSVCGTDEGVCQVGAQSCQSDGTLGFCMGSVGANTTNDNESIDNLCNGDDDDCDGIVDEGCGCVAGQTQNCGSASGVCSLGMQTCTGAGSFGSCVGNVAPNTVANDESVDALCNGDDDDCDGMIDEGCGCVPPLTQACGTDTGVCVAGTRQCEESGSFGACVGATGPASSNPSESAAGLCNGLDDNCDGTTDEGCACTIGQSLPCGSSTGVCAEGTQTCASNGMYGSCQGNTGPNTTSGDESVDGLCDGSLDDDCDGNVDEGCSCSSGQTQPCGTNTGVCVQGSQTCDGSGALGACTGETGPNTASDDESTNSLCDGTNDDDCDGTIDEGCSCSVGENRSCGSDVGVCSSGVEPCGADGSYGACQGATGPTTTNDDESVDSLCNGDDDDCDGMVDEGCGCAAGQTQSCGSAQGVCTTGVQTCQNNGVYGACTGATAPNTTNDDESVDALCNGDDDDCDGATDEGCGCVSGAMQACGSSVGVCAQGTQTCQSNGSFGACAGQTTANTTNDDESVDSLCNGDDDDCDGMTDEGCGCTAGQTQPCGTNQGVCSTGTQTCGAGGVFGACIGQTGPNTNNNNESVDSLCDGSSDDDCDGAVDEGCGCSVGDTQGCGSNVGECQAGQLQCQLTGSFGSTCVGEVGPAARMCGDGNDYDCDGTPDDQQSPCVACTPFQVTMTPAGSSIWPHAEWNGTEFGMVWEERDFQINPATREIFFKRLDATGDAIANSEVQLTSNTAANSTTPRISWNGTQYGVVWEDDRTGTPLIYFARLTAAGVKIGNDVIVGSDTGRTGEAPISPLDIAWNGSAWGVTWESIAAGTKEVFFRLVNASGVPQGSQSQISGGAATESQNPKMVWDGASFFVVWGDERHHGGDSEIYGVKVSATGTVGAEIRISNQTGDSVTPELTANGTGYAVVWRDRRMVVGAMGVIEFVRLDANGTEIAGSKRTLRDGTTQTYIPAVAWSGSNYEIVWNDVDPSASPMTTDEIFYSVLDATGTTVLAPTVIGIVGTGASGYEQVVWNGTNFVITYYDGSIGNNDIYSSRTDEAGVCL